MKFIFKLLTSTLLFLGALTTHGELVQAPMTAELISLYKNKTISDKELAQSVKWSGINDEKLFDIVESRFLKAYKNRSLLEENSWRVQLLTLSGNPKYVEAIKKGLDKRNPKLKRHSKSSLEIIEKFTR